jgi:uncharacterized membrane protein
MEQNTQNQPQMQQNKEDNTVAVIAYITLIGWIIALIMHSNNKTKLGAYHLRDMFGLILTSLVLWVVSFIPFIGPVLYLLGVIFLFVLWLIGLINAVNREMKPLPVIGDLFQKWFATMFN